MATFFNVHITNVAKSNGENEKCSQRGPNIKKIHKLRYGEFAVGIPTVATSIMLLCFMKQFPPQLLLTTSGHENNRAKLSQIT